MPARSSRTRRAIVLSGLGAGLVTLVFLALSRVRPAMRGAPARGPDLAPSRTLGEEPPADELALPREPALGPQRARHGGLVRRVDVPSSRPLEGTLTAALVAGGEASPTLELPVRGGRFSFVAESGADHLLIEAFTGRGETLWPATALLRIADRALTVDLSAAALLHVFDAEDHRELERVSLACADRRRPASALPHTGLAEGLSPRAPLLPAPLRVDALDAGCLVHLVSAPGHVWAPVPLGPFGSRRVDVSLARAGSLELRLEGAFVAFGEEPRVRLLADGPDHRPFEAYAFALEGRDTTWGKLQPGSYAVWIVSGDEPTVPRSAPCTAVVRAGATTVVSIAPATEPRARGSLVLRGSAAALARVEGVRLMRIDGLPGVPPRIERSLADAERDGDGSISWSLAGVVSGLWQIEVEPWAFYAYREVPADAGFGLELELLEPVVLSLRLVDPRTRASVDDVACRVASGFPGEEDLLCRHTLGENVQGADGVFTLDVLPGPLRVAVLGPRCGSRSFLVDPRGKRSIELELPSPREVRVDLVAGGAPFPRDEAWWTRARLVDSGGSVQTLSIAAGQEGLGTPSCSFFVPAPGSYRLRLPPLDSGKSVPDVPLTVGEETEPVTVDLTSWTTLAGLTASGD